MKNFTLGQVIGIPVALSKKYAEEDLPGIPVSTSESVAPIKERKRSSFNWIRKFRRSSEDTSKGEGIGHGKDLISFLILILIFGISFLISQIALKLLHLIQDFLILWH